MSADTQRTDYVLEQVLDKARAARDGHFDVLSTGEKLTVALVLNQPELLSKMGYTMAEAVERVGPEWVARVPEAARVLEHEAELARENAAPLKRDRGIETGSDMHSEIHNQRPLNTIHRRPDIVEIADAGSLRALHDKLEISANVSPSCNANTATNSGGKEIRRVTSSVHVTSKI